MLGTCYAEHSVYGGAGSKDSRICTSVSYEDESRYIQTMISPTEPRGQAVKH